MRERTLAESTGAVLKISTPRLDLIFLAKASNSFQSTPPSTDIDPLLFGVSSRSPYRRIALGNIAYCYGQLGEGEKATEYYERVLAEDPTNAVAISCLRMLRSSQGAEPRV